MPPLGGSPGVARWTGLSGVRLQAFDRVGGARHGPIDADSPLGGFSLAQAGFDETALLGMPSSAAATGLVDEVVPVEQMPARLLTYAEHLGRISDRKAPDGTRRDATEYLTRDLRAPARQAWPRL